MNKEFFREQIVRLERSFNQSRELDPKLQDEYFKALKNFREIDLIKTIDDVIQTYKPRWGAEFPSISIILDSMNDILSQKSEPTIEEVDGLFGCRICGGTGKFIDDKSNSEVFCCCEKGQRLKAARMEYIKKHGKSFRAPMEKQKALRPVMPESPRKEWNPRGFWEDTKEEHERWCAAKRSEIEEIKKRVEERKARLAAAKKVVRPESIREIVKETIRQIEETRPLRAAIKEEVLERKLGEDEEECPF